MKTLVVGATGLLGPEICRRLTEAGHQVRALIRRTSDAGKRAALERLGVELVEGDLKDPRLPRARLRRRPVGHLDRFVDAFQAGRATLSKASTNRDSWRWSRPHGRPASSTSCSSRSATTPSIQFPLTVAKRAVERALKSSGMAYTILQASYFMEVWLTPALGFDAANGKVRLYGDGSHPISWISYRDVARAAAAAVTEPDRPEHGRGARRAAGAQPARGRPDVRSGGRRGDRHRERPRVGARGADERGDRSASEVVRGVDAAVRRRRCDRHDDQQPAVSVSDDLGARLHHRAARCGREASHATRVAARAGPRRISDRRHVGSGRAATREEAADA